MARKLYGYSLLSACPWQAQRLLIGGARSLSTSRAFAEAPASTQPAAPQDQPHEAAKAAYARGAEAFRGGQFEEAISQFSAADRLVPRAELAYDIARAHEQLRNVGAALRFYLEYLRRAPTARNRDEVERRVAALEATLMARGVQLLTVLSTPSAAEVQIDGKRVGSTPFSEELAPGSHRLALGKAGYEASEQLVTLTREHALLVEVSLPAEGARKPTQSAPLAAKSGRAPSPPSPRDARTPSGTRPARSAGWITIGAGGAALIGGAICEILRRNAQNEAAAATTSQVRFQDRLEASDSYQTAARVSTTVGATLVLSGAALLYWDSRHAQASTSGAAFFCAPRLCAASWAARF
jgi:tetratricopeptide (TPR) repeat protein